MEKSTKQLNTIKMKKVLFIALLGFATLTASAQTKVQQDKNGNYTAVSTKAKTDSVNTGKTFTTSKGEVYPVFKGSKGGLFINRVSKKTGKQYRQYLKAE